MRDQMKEPKMALIEWMDLFSVGNADMDGDHQALLDILNRLYEAWASGQGAQEVGAVFDELTAYTQTHFTREEALLEAAHYDRLQVQKAEHAHLLEQLEVFRERHLAHEDLGVLTDEIVEFLRSWMINHILDEDMRYRGAVSGLQTPPTA
jgi:hemerythrin